MTEMVAVPDECGGTAASRISYGRGSLELGRIEAAHSEERDGSV